MGLTCDAYQTHLKWTQEEGTTVRNIGKLTSLNVIYMLDDSNFVIFSSIFN